MEEDEEDEKQLLKRILNEIIELKELIKNGNNDMINKEKENKDESIKIVKKELMDIEENKVISILKERNIEKDIKMIKEYYLKEEDSELPIRKKNKKDYLYWNGEEWVTDRYGKLLKVILIENLKMIYKSVNNKKNFDNQNIIYNQEYIYDMDKPIYKNKILIKLMEE